MENQRDILKDVIDQGHLGLAELNAEGVFVSANPAFLSMLGMCEADLIGNSWTVSVHPEDRRRATAAYYLARSTGRGYVEIRGARMDHRIVYQALIVTGTVNEKGDFAGYHCLRHNISGYKGDQEALSLAVESSPNGLLMIDASGKIQSVNRAVEKLFGYTRDELAGQRIETLLPERFRGGHLVHRDSFNRSETTKAMAGRDLVGLRKDGAEIPLQVYLNRIETAAGELILCTILDIGERVRYQQQLELAKQAAEGANRAKSDFLARMSHEIRTPMNLIMGMNALLLNSPLNDKQREQVEISYRNVRRLLRLINGILDLSKVEAGKLTLDAAPFDIRTVLFECAATMSFAIEQKGLHFEMSIAPDTWSYWIGDAERLQQVLLNLIGNSIKFTAKGVIGLKVCGESGASGERGLRFEVRDTGCGIPADKAGIIFEAFQQAEGSMNRPHEGTGLGLSIAKTLVEMMSGRIWVDELETQGSRFVFTAFFPPTSEAAILEHRSPASTASVAQRVEPGTRLLIVEDNPENVVLLRAYLEGVAVSLSFATNGVEAVDYRRNADCDLILMDIQMPIMDGYTATRKIRSWEKAQGLPRVPIVALTAHALNSARAESDDAGCDGHLTKPVERNELVEAIANFARHYPARPAAVPDSMASLRPAFLANRSKDLAKMRVARLANNLAVIQTIGHNCKGTGAGYGFPEIGKAGAALENAARAQDLTELDQAILGFESALESATQITF